MRGVTDPDQIKEILAEVGAELKKIDNEIGSGKRYCRCKPDAVKEWVLDLEKAEAE